ncbi:PFU (PLAA family ubiquitin binding) domain-containing protein [Spironucleus salmonicida]|nr:PFU (PLAA family ubiquitin binding) domain-containing protein [Spironucleus salmonicida]
MHSQKLAQKDIKDLYFSQQLQKLHVASLDGILYQVDPFHPSEPPIELVQLDAITALSGNEDSIILTSASGIILKMYTSGDVDQLKLKTQSRPRSIDLYNDDVVVGDWDGNLYFNDYVHKFAKFNYDNREVENGVNCVKLAHGRLFAGLSSGEVAIFDAQNVRGGPISCVQPHKHPVRALLIYAADAFFSAGNDGVCYFSYFAGGQFQSVVVSPRVFESEYIFTLDITEHAGRTLIAIGGTGFVVGVVDVSEVLVAFHAKHLVDAAPCLLHLAPVESDVWSVRFCGELLAVGQEDGTLSLLALGGQGIDSVQDELLDRLSSRTVDEGKFAGDSKNRLNARVLHDSYEFADLASIQEISPPNPMFLCSLGGQIALVLKFGGKYVQIGTVPVKTEGVLDAKNQKWDFCYEVSTEGGRMLKLFMNADEDSYTAGTRFLAENGVDGDAVDQIQQIREFIDRNAPKTSICDFILPDCAQLFKSGSKVSGKAGVQKAFEQGVPAVQQVTPLVAEKAFRHIAAAFSPLGMDGCAQAITYSTGQIPESEQQKAAFFCVLVYLVQTGALDRHRFDGFFVQTVCEAFLEATAQSLAVMSARLLSLLMGPEIRALINGKADRIVAQALQYLGKHDAECLVYSLMRQLGPQDISYGVLQTLMASESFE